MNVAVLGASGTIGRPLIAELARAHDVVAVSRSQHEAPEGVLWKTADATERDSVARVLEGVEVVYYLVHSLGSGDFEKQDLRAAETVANEAERPGISSSSIWVGSATTPPISRLICAAVARRVFSWRQPRSR
jgi:uncharacterized protein YbjT (DUF2867 family)